MRRFRMTERLDWRAKAEEYGFPFHTIGGEVYWDETVAWSFTLREIEEDLEAPTGELEQMCLAFVGEALKREPILRKLDIPDAYWSFLRDSWSRGERNLYGRFDLAYDGTGPAKLLEYNADTPTSLFEAAVFQWTWLEDQMAAGRLPEGSDQFNSLHERLVEAFRGLRRGETYRLHLAAVGDSVEDKATVAYIADCARQAGLDTKQLSIETSASPPRRLHRPRGPCPSRSCSSSTLGMALPGGVRPAPSASGTQFIEPPWKALLSTKGLCPCSGHGAEPSEPACPPSSPTTRAPISSDRVEKPLHSREGANIRVIRAGGAVESTPGDYGGPAIVQALAPTARFEGGHAVIGSWVVASQPSGIGIREDAGAITRDTARFVPHCIEPE